MAKNNNEKSAYTILAYTPFVLWTVLTILPLFWLFYSSLKEQTEILVNMIALPQEFYFLNYVNAWVKGQLGVYFGNSIIYTTVSTALILLFAMMAAFALSKMPEFSRYNKIFLGIITLGLLITVHAILIPLFMLYTQVGLINTRIAVITTYVALGLPLAIFLGQEYMGGLPDALMESAHLDGATNWRIFFQILLPMSTPVLVSIGILSLLGNWNEFLMAFILTSEETKKSLPVGILSFSGRTSTQYGQQFAALVIAVAPIIILYLFFNKKITEGVVAGSLK